MPKNRRPVRPPRPLVPEPMLLVLREKHATLFFHIPNEKKLFEVALDILTKRDKAGFWYYEPGVPPKPPELSAEDVEKLPDGKTKDFARNALEEYKLVKLGYDNDLEALADRKKAIAEKDGRLAYRVLGDHSDGEYQRVTLENYCDTYYEYP